jgi:hypothetical protein
MHDFEAPNLSIKSNYLPNNINILFINSFTGIINFGLMENQALPSIRFGFNFTFF